MMKEIKQRSYTNKFREEAVELAKEIGAQKAASQINIPVDTLYTWIARAKKGELKGVKSSAEPKESLSLAQRNKELEAENSMLRSEVTMLKKERNILEDATVFFASRQKK